MRLGTGTLTEVAASSEEQCTHRLKAVNQKVTVVVVLVSTLRILYQGSRFRYFGCFRCLVLFDKRWDLLGPGGFEKGPGVDSDSFGPSSSPKGPFWVHFGPILLSILLETRVGPK